MNWVPAPDTLGRSTTSFCQCPNQSRSSVVTYPSETLLEPSALFRDSPTALSLQRRSRRKNTDSQPRPPPWLFYHAYRREQSRPSRQCKVHRRRIYSGASRLVLLDVHVRHVRSNSKIPRGRTLGGHLDFRPPVKSHGDPLMTSVYVPL